MELLENHLFYWLCALPIALILSLQVKGCDVNPEPVPAAVLPLDAQAQAQQEVAAVAVAYSKMTDEERMRGIVYEPVNGGD